MPFGSEIEAMLEEVRNQVPERRVYCPICDYPLGEKDGKLFCEYCGWQER